MVGCRCLILIALTILFGHLPAQEPSVDLVAGIAKRKSACPEAERHLWNCLHLLCQRQEADKTNREDWLALAKRDAGATCLTADSPVKIKVLSGLGKLVQPIEARYHLWVVPAGGAAYLVSVPDDGLLGTTNLLIRMQEKLLVQPGENRALTEEKRALAGKILVGDRKEAWFVSIVRLYPAPGLPFGNGQVKVTLAGNQIKLTPAGAKSVLVPMPDEMQLAAWLGQPFAPPPNAAGNVPMGGGKIYLALDWSRYLASPLRRQWLVGELQHVLRGVNPASLMEGSIYLHANKTVVAWSLEDIRQGKLPPDAERGISPHERETLDTLAEFIAHTDRQRAGISRLYFLTWNPGVTIDATLLDSDLASVPRFSKLPALCKNMPLRIVQIGGDKRHTCLGSLSNRGYYTLPFGDGTEPSLTLPHWDE